ncbi:MAG: hypothetical protein RLZZ126_242 [Pseudomonadota bacterium]
MKKTLVALAALAATASFAQSSVTIPGAVATALNSNSTRTGAGVTTDSLGFFNNPTGTTSVIFTGTEDLGGGMKGLFLYELDPNANMNNAVALSGEVFVGLSGGFGTVKLGTPNMPTLSVSAGRNPFGTKTGGGYSGVQGSALVRMPASLRYDSPSFNGFGVALAWAPEVPTASVAAANPDNAALTNTLVAGAAQTDISLSYSNGPLSAAVSNYNRSDVAVGSAAIPAGATGLRQTNYNISYAFGAARVFFGGYSQDDLGVAAATSSGSNGNNLGLRYDMANMTFLANYAIRRNNNSSNGTQFGDQRIWGLGFDYNFSKRTAAVVRINNQTNDNGTAVVGTAEVRNAMVGLIHKF